MEGGVMDKTALLEEARVLAEKVQQQADMPFRCWCGEMATLHTSHGENCAVTAAEILLPKLNEVLLGKDG